MWLKAPARLNLCPAAGAAFFRAPQDKRVNRAPPSWCRGW